MLFTAARRAFAAAANGGFARPARRGLSVGSSGAPDVAPRRLNSKDAHVVEKFKNCKERRARVVQSKVPQGPTRTDQGGPPKRGGVRGVARGAPADCVP